MSAAPEHARLHQPAHAGRSPIGDEPCRDSRRRRVCALALAGAALTARADDKPIRVLLFAGAATHEYQFVRNLLARDGEKGPFHPAVYLQAPPGRTEPRDGVEQGAPCSSTSPTPSSARGPRTWAGSTTSPPTT